MEEGYLDEIILRERRKREKLKFVEDIMENGLPEEMFQVVSIGEEIAEIKLPAFLENMPEELVQRKYAFDPQPQIVMTNSGRTVDCTISVLDIEIPINELQENVSEAKRGMQHFSPTIMWSEEGFEEINDTAICWFSYVGNMIDGRKTYNIYCYAAAKKVILFTMSCDYAIQREWEAITKYCMRTLKGKVNSGQK